MSWKYDRETNNGMPLEEINMQMIDLEGAIENSVDSSEKYRHAYSRTGNGLKELVYYSVSQDDFMDSLNESLATHKRYPIEIVFFEDSLWSELKKMIENFEE